MDVLFVEDYRGHAKGEQAHLPFHEAKPLLELGIVRPAHRRRSKAVPDDPERAVKR